MYGSSSKIVKSCSAREREQPRALLGAQRVAGRVLEVGDDVRELRAHAARSSSVASAVDVDPVGLQLDHAHVGAAVAQVRAACGRRSGDSTTTASPGSTSSSNRNASACIEPLVTSTCSTLDAVLLGDPLAQRHVADATCRRRSCPPGSFVERALRGLAQALHVDDVERRRARGRRRSCRPWPSRIGVVTCGTGRRRRSSHEAPSNARPHERRPSRSSRRARRSGPRTPAYDEARAIRNGLRRQAPGPDRALRAAPTTSSPPLARGATRPARGSRPRSAATTSPRRAVSRRRRDDRSRRDAARVAIAAERGTATAGGGVLWTSSTLRDRRRTALAVDRRRVSSTGVAGLTLGGGLGWLMGKYGLAADNLVGGRAGRPPTATCSSVDDGVAPGPAAGRCAAAAATSASPRRSRTGCTRSRRSPAG